jgi:thiamine biosynthesis lipoprotein
MAIPEHDISFKAMGCDLRVLVGPGVADQGESAQQACERIKELIEQFDRRMTRFSPDSELSVLNSDLRMTVPASPLLRSVVSAGLWAAQASNGLLDPTLVGQLEKVGYAKTMRERKVVSLREALDRAPLRRPAHPSDKAAWKSIIVDDDAGTITRPVGVRIDSGGVGKGLIADAAAATLTDRVRFCVNAAGDLRIGGPDAAADPYPVVVESPFGADPIATIRVAAGAVATSGIDSRLWRTADGGFAHHLLDPSTGLPAWTGLVQVTAFADTALEAETLSKRVLLAGAPAIHLLEQRGGVTVSDSGEVELIGPVADTVRHARFGPIPDLTGVAA